MHALTQLLEHLAMKAYLQKSQWHAVLTLNVSINFTKRRAARYVGRANMWLGWRYYRKGNHSLSLKYTFNHVISCFLFCALGDLIKHPLVCVQFFFNQHDSSRLTGLEGIIHPYESWFTCQVIWFICHAHVRESLIGPFHAKLSRDDLMSKAM